ncbi:MAG: DUF3048 domain-containing protein [Anaerolineales bacterium]|nr:DUF3048 domain-containing protein [Anaerolineales bacterium]
MRTHRTPSARNQADLADVVYEYYIEWGYPFYRRHVRKRLSMVGPARSGRYFDEHIARMYNAFLVFKFADPREYSYLQNSTLNEFLVVPGGSGCPPFVLALTRSVTITTISFLIHPNGLRAPPARDSIIHPRSFAADSSPTKPWKPRRQPHVFFVLFQTKL